MFGRDIVLLATQKPGTGGLFDIIRPNTGASLFDMPAEVSLCHHLCCTMLLMGTLLNSNRDVHLCSYA